MMVIMISNDDCHYEDDGDQGLSIYYGIRDRVGGRGGEVFPIDYNIT